jgi:IS30 family transposase
MKVVEILRPHAHWIHTITADNGKEFAGNKKIAQQIGIDFYFAKPYHYWQRGANENINGLIRQYFPKSSSFESITNNDIQYVQHKLNNRPRKKIRIFNSY